MQNKYIYAYTLEDAKEKAASSAKQGYQVVGVEAEWGDSDLKEVFPQVSESLSHHGKYSDLPPPCTRWDLHGKYKENTVFVFSHFDLDSIFGCWILEGRLDDDQNNREITDHIAWCDVNGGHRAHEDYDNYVKWNGLVSMLGFYLKKLKKQKADAFKIVNEMYTNYRLIYNKYINEGNHERRKNTMNLEAYNALDKTFSIQNKLHVFMSYTNYLNKYYIETDDFVSISEVNVLYDTKKKRVAIGVYNEQLAKKYFGENGVLDILKKYFGEEAGGRITVGGSPKNQEVSFTQFLKFVKEIKKLIEGSSA